MRRSRLCLTCSTPVFEPCRRTIRSCEPCLLLPIYEAQDAYYQANDIARIGQPFCRAHVDSRPGGIHQCIFPALTGDWQSSGPSVDRTRAVVKDLHGAEIDPATRSLWITHLGRLEKRGALLVRAMTCFYSAIGCFAAASVVSILGASVVATQYKWVFQAIVIISFVLGTVGFTGLAVGCSFLVTETRLAIRSMNEEAQLARDWFK